jgi:undecaprenyl-diphosphatase
MVLGVVQGLTEFLPVSSSGHLVVAERAIGLRTPGVLVEVVLHVATLLAVVVVYRGRLGQLLTEASRGSRDALRYVGLLAIGTLPVAIVGLLLKDWVESAFDSLLVVGLSFLATGSILWSTRWALSRGTKVEPTLGGAGTIGVAQALALLPGISRSGSTVSAAMWLGVDPVRAAEYSFLLSIPAIMGAAILQLPDLRTEVNTVGPGPMAVSFAAALIAGVTAIRMLVALLRRGAFHRFAPYCVVLGVLTLVWWSVHS